jgi:hypothetical protein
MQIAMPIPLTVAPPARRFQAPVLRDDAAFDAWIRRELVAAHADIMQEPVPQRLLDVLAAGHFAG